MAVTIKDIANAAGVSHTTVSRALKGNKVIAPQTAARICQIAEELGYVPNTVARGLKTNRSYILGIIVRRIGDPYFADIQRGIEEALHQNNYRMILTSSKKDALREAEIIRAMSEHRVDGVIICSSQVNESHRLKLEKFGMPTVLMNNQADDNHPLSIRHDDIHGCRLLVRHLIQLGHKRIAYLGHANAGLTNDNRFMGFVQEIESAGLQFDSRYHLLSQRSTPENGRLAIKPLTQMDAPPTAMICYNDILAIGAMKGLKEAGWNIPQDFSITGFDNISLASFVEPPLTTFNQPKYEIGYQAAELMLAYLASRDKGEPFHSNTKILKGKLIVRQSTTSAIEL